MPISATSGEAPSSAPEISYVRDDYAQGIKVPWHAKMTIKIILAMLPVPYWVWEKIGIFRHGDVNKSLPNLHKGFERYVAAYKDNCTAPMENVLELGPGDSIGHALSAYAHGAKKGWLVDVGDFATVDEGHYKAYTEFLVQGGHWPSDTGIPTQFSRSSILALTNFTYLSQGLKDLKTLSGSVLDFSCSSAVFEHIRRAESRPHERAFPDS
jgi:hypothetical protein